MKRLPLLLFCCCIVGLVVNSCKNHTSQQKDDLHQAKGGKYYGGTYRVNENGELRSLDPVQVNDVTSAHLVENIYDQLMYFDKDLRLTYEIATARNISEDGLTYTYTIRPNVFFHDDKCFPDGKGRELTAQDVVYSFTRICDARTGTLGSEFYREKVVGASEYYDATQKVTASGSEPSIKGVAGYTAPDKYTFQIKLEKAFGPFEYMVALNNACIVPHEAVEKYGTDFFQHPVGTGPFVFHHWTPDNECLLVRNEKYWKYDSDGNQLPYLDKIHTTFIKDDKVQLLEFREGNLEDSYRIPNEFFTKIVNENKQLQPEFSKYVLQRIPALSTQYYGMMTKSNAFKDKRVRQAFSYAIDRNRIIRYVLKGQAFAPSEHGLVPPVMPDYNHTSIKGYQFDVQKARTLMKEAGYPDGKGFPTITLQLNSGGGRNTQIAEAIQTMLIENLGITIKLKMVEFAQHLTEIDHGRAEFYRLGWVADYPDPETFLNLFYGKTVPKTFDVASPQNGSRYQNPTFDSLFELARSTPDKLQRNHLFEQAEQLAINDSPLLLIFHDEDYRLLQPYVRGYVNNSMDKRPYMYVWFDKNAM
ncbi:MAG: ABC transporter substrate-binding protein [Candidatus Kapaibacterium sp.]